MTAAARRIAVVTGGRADYGLLRPVMAAIRNESSLSLQVIAAAAHLSPAKGLTVRDIEADGFAIAARVEMLHDGDTPLATAKSIGVGTQGFADAFVTLKPDIVILLGDRFEILAAAVAALPLGIPLAHIHGGEASEGAYDEQIRHAVTKMSHLHFVAAEPYRKRILAMGENPDSVTVTGAPGLDNIATAPAMTRQQLAEALEFPLDDAPLLITYHPATLDMSDAAPRLQALLDALSAIDKPLIVTAPNADAGNRAITAQMEAFCTSRPRAKLFASLGTSRFLNTMRHAAAMVGNSSAGIIEAPSFELPVVNVGLRQTGRLRAANVIDCEETAGAVSAAVSRALDPAFRASLKGLKNPYGDGHAGPRIAHILAQAELGPSLLRKKFHG
jgi:UDP-hydrolysing UDP-N-acetyl-D-glucosamine 2-epimerase